MYLSTAIHLTTSLLGRFLAERALSNSWGFPCQSCYGPCVHEAEADGFPVRCNRNVFSQQSLADDLVSTNAYHFS